MLVYLSFLVCLGSSCHTTIPSGRAFIGISACQLEGMEIAPQWEDANHPWHVAKVRCSIGNKPRAEDAA